VFFDVRHLYYLPQYLPVYNELIKMGVKCEFLLYRQKHLNDTLDAYVKTHGLVYLWANDKEEANNIYLQKKPEWIIFGNAEDNLDDIHCFSKTALMQHGIGPKSCYYDVSNSAIMYRFVEGKHRLKRLTKLFPEKVFIDTGYAKLDPIINNNTDEHYSLSSLALDPSKKTILYAPTFYPSSIECLPQNFPELLKKYNIIIKPHFFSLIKNKYKAQQKKLKHWESYANVYVSGVSDVSILPFMQLAALIISDASSALFEFAALNKPAVWCDFYKLRWSYRGIFKYRFNKRLDKDLAYFEKVAAKTTNVQELMEQVELHINNPQLNEAERTKTSEHLVGKVDGKCSARIAHFLVTGTH
tara:strand:+ start:219 stop:1286 length:1068 start_codon:yes stop_codon:yes gene_type:complete